MHTSDQINELAAALAKAQPKFEVVVKDKTVTTNQYSYTYAGLDSVVASIRAPLSENGLAFMQGVHQIDGRLVVETMLTHSSGQWMRAALPVACKMDAAPQTIGSAISYARRYGLSSLLGIVTEDDDDGARAEASHGKSENNAGRSRGKGAARVQDAGSAPAQQHPTSEEAKARFSANRATVDAWQNLHRILGKNGCTVLSNDHPRYPDYRKWLHAKLEQSLNEPVPSFSGLTADAIARATTIINDWFVTEDLKPFTIEETLL